MSRLWSSFGLENTPEDRLLGNVNNENSSSNRAVDERKDIFNDSDGGIFFSDKSRLPIMIKNKNKPLKRTLPDSGNRQEKNFGKANLLQPETCMVPLHKRQNNTDRNKSKWTKALNSRFLVKAKEMREFFKLTDDPVINDFLKRDSCKRIADKYLLAMVFAYFKRADFDLQDYNRTNFFIALYLANDVEEDEELMKHEIFPWALGKDWADEYVSFLRKRDLLFRRIEYKAIISCKCCDEIMNIEPDNVLWKRERPPHHAGAMRSYIKDAKDNRMPRGPNASPLFCPECDLVDSQYDSASSNSLTWLISPDLSPSQ